MVSLPPMVMGSGETEMTGTPSGRVMSWVREETAPRTVEEEEGSSWISSTRVCSSSLLRFSSERRRLLDDTSGSSLLSAVV